MANTEQEHSTLLNQPIDRRTLLTGAGKTLVAAAGATTLLAGAGVALAQQQTGRKSTDPEPLPAAKYDRVYLERMMNTYLEAIAAGDPSRAPFASNAIFAETNQQLALGDGPWKTVNRIGRYRHHFAEPENALAGVLAVAYEHDVGCILIATIKIEDDKIAWAEQFIIRDANGARVYEQMGQPDPIWLEPIPPAQRQAREALEAAAWIYFQSLERNDGAGVYPFRDDCDRIEHARPTVRQKRPERYGHADLTVDFVTLPAKAQYELGMMAFVTRIRDRRASVVDIERGAVLGQSGWDFDGTLQTINFKSGQAWHIPPYFRTPRTHQVTEAFKLINGSFRYIEMTLMEVPFGSRQVIPGRPMTVSLAYTPTRPVAKPVPASSDADLRALTQSVLDAMIRNCPCDAPFAADARYTENGITVMPGEGLWKSLVGLREYGLFLTDPSSGQAGWIGTLNEQELFAALVLRLKTKGGLITEVEAIIARPEFEATITRRDGQNADVELKGATFSMFVAPLLADLDPKAFPRPDAALTKSVSNASRADLLGAVDKYYDAFSAMDGASAPLAAGCKRRENGIAACDNAEGKVIDQDNAFRLYARDLAGELSTGFLARLAKLRDRRTLLVDEKQGLVLDLALLDNPAAATTLEVPNVGRLKLPAFCTTPWTDLHAALFKIDGNRIAHIEDLVRRVPYGQESGWKA